MRNPWRARETYLRGFLATLTERPRAILAISGHWEEDVPTVNAGAHPSLLFDYEGFPDYTDRLTWPTAGASALAARVGELLSDAGIANGTQHARGWDHDLRAAQGHGAKADIPLVQLSLQHGLDPAAHLAIGRALKPLRNEGVLIIGSGQTYHNMRGFFSGEAVDEKAEAFDGWLRAAMIGGTTRDEALIRWEDAPHARVAQPHEDHLLPLMIAAGAASGETGIIHFHSHALGKPISGLRFG